MVASSVVREIRLMALVICLRMLWRASSWSLLLLLGEVQTLRVFRAELVFILLMIFGWLLMLEIIICLLVCVQESEDGACHWSSPSWHNTSIISSGLVFHHQFFPCLGWLLHLGNGSFVRVVFTEKVSQRSVSSTKASMIFWIWSIFWESVILGVGNRVLYEFIRTIETASQIVSVEPLPCRTP